jgi:MFS family permease
MSQVHRWRAFTVLAVSFFMTIVPVSIAALAGVGRHEAGLASGLLNTSQQLGGAIGVAVASTVAGTHFKTLLRDGSTAPAALNGGFHWALWVCAVVALLALPVTLLLGRGDELAKVVASTRQQDSVSSTGASWQLTDPNPISEGGTT